MSAQVVPVADLMDAFVADDLFRQSKETLGQQRLNLDINGDQARATVVQSWGQLDAARAQIEATTAQVNAAEIALNRVLLGDTAAQRINQVHNVLRPWCGVFSRLVAAFY